jgi:hypothetical protein
VALGFILMYAFAALARLVVGDAEMHSEEKVSVQGFITHYSYALAPLAMLLLLADLLDHLLRNLSTFTDATVSTVRDFPFGFPAELSSSALLGEDMVRTISTILIFTGYVFSVFMVYKISFSIFKDGDARIRSFLCMNAATLAFTAVGLWLVYAPAFD